MVLYDVSSSYYEGQTRPLVFFGHSHDKKKGKPIIVYGVMTNKEGVPVSIEVYPCDTGEPSTVSDQTGKRTTIMARKLREVEQLPETESAKLLEMDSSQSTTPVDNENES